MLNFHSHDRNSGIVTLTPEEYETYTPHEGQRLTVGIHPWDTEDDQMSALSTLAIAMNDPKVVALGEVGIDPLKGAPIERQQMLLRLQLQLTVAAQKPVVFHVVRRYTDIISFRRHFQTSAPWAIHGFRGKPEVVKQLIPHGIYMSLGRNFNPESARLIPDSLLLVETDEEPDSALPEIVEAIAAVRGTDPARLADICRANLRRFYSL